MLLPKQVSSGCSTEYSRLLRSFTSLALRSDDGNNDGALNVFYECNSFAGEASTWRILTIVFVSVDCTEIWFFGTFSILFLHGICFTLFSLIVFFVCFFVNLTSFSTCLLFLSLYWGFGICSGRVSVVMLDEVPWNTSRWFQRIINRPTPKSPGDRGSISTITFLSHDADYCLYWRIRWDY